MKTKQRKKKQPPIVAEEVAQTVAEATAIVTAETTAVVDVQKDKIPYPPFEKVTELVVQALRTAFSYGCTVLEACAHAGISKSTYYTFVEAYPDMLDTFEALQLKPFMGARQAVIKSFPVRPDIAMRYLEAKLPNEFNPKNAQPPATEVNINFSLELKERTKKYEPRIIDVDPTPEIPPPEVGHLEG